MQTVLIQLLLSLQATWIRNTITRALKDTSKTGMNVNALPSDVIFENPTTLSLAQFISQAATRSSHSDDAMITIYDKVKAMHKAVETYAHNFPARPDRIILQREGKDIILVTGTTGSFGAQILSTLVHASHISRIYSVNRKGGTLSLLDRQLAMFKQQGVSSTVLQSQKLILIEADMEEEGFGLNAELFDEVRTSFCTIVMPLERPS
jgi:hypothetical protein